MRRHKFTWAIIIILIALFGNMLLSNSSGSGVDVRYMCGNGADAACYVRQAQAALKLYELKNRKP